MDSSKPTITQMAFVKLSGPENNTKGMNVGNEFVGERFTEMVGDKSVGR